MPSNAREGAALELALLGDAFVRLIRAFDAVLLFVALGREHAHDLVNATGVTAAEQACDDVNIVADAELVSQESLRDTQSFAAPQQQRMNRSSCGPCPYNSTKNRPVRTETK